MNKKGFSLIEVVASFVIVGVSLVGILKMFSMASVTSVYQQDALNVSNLMQMKIEEIKAKDFSDNFNENNFTYTAFPQYRFDVTQSVNFFGNQLLKRIAVTMTWTDSLGGPRGETIYFLKADY